MISTGLSDNIINKITDVFKSYYQVEKVVLYGSRAKGTYKKGSDIDLTMLGSELSFQLLLDISDKIDELLLPYMIDLSIFDNLTNDKLKEHINRVGIVFYERKLPLKQGWELKKLGDIGNLYNGNSIKENVKKNKYTGIENGLPFIATKDVSFENKIDYNNGVKIPFNEINIFKVAPKNTVLICAEGGSAGRKIGYTNQDVCFGNKLFALTTNKSIDSRFVYYYYLSSSFQKDFTTELVGIIGGVSMSKFKELKIPIPPLPEQQKIVSILDKVFTAIDQAKQHVEQNIQNAKELFNSYLSGIFTNKGKNWEEKTLGEVLQKTETIDPTKYPTKEFVYLDVSSVNKETKEIDMPTILLGIDAPSRARKLIKTNDLIFATVRPTHSRVALITKEYNEQICSTGYCVLRPKNCIISNLIYYFLLTYNFNEQMEKLQKGASYPAVTDNEVKSIKITYPTLIDEQVNIIKTLDLLLKNTKQLETIYQQKLTKLEELKKSILQKAFNGELI